MPWTPLIEWQRCPEGRGVFIESNGRELAVFRLAGPDRAAVIDNTCPHAGGNLSGGSLAGNVVTCPWHEWPFDVETGRCIFSDKASVMCYPAQLRDGQVWVDIE